jgi:hypothetical protein
MRPNARWQHQRYAEPSHEMCEPCTATPHHRVNGPPSGSLAVAKAGEEATPRYLFGGDRPHKYGASCDFGSPARSARL